MSARAEPLHAQRLRNVINRESRARRRGRRLEPRKARGRLAVGEATTAQRRYDRGTTAADEQRAKGLHAILEGRNWASFYL